LAEKVWPKKSFGRISLAEKNLGRKKLGRINIQPEFTYFDAFRFLFMN